MLRRLLLGSPRACSVRVRFLSGVALSVVATLPSARAQQPPTAQQEPPDAQQQTSPAANQAHLPAIVVAAPKLKPKPKPRTNTGAPPRATQEANATTAAQAALDAKMGGLDQARDNLLPKI